MSYSLKQTLEKLNLNEDNGLHIRGKDLPEYPLRMKQALNSIEYDAIYNLKEKPLIIFKEFENNTNDLEEKIYLLHKKIWNFGEAPILFIILPNEIRIYNGFIFEKDREKNEVLKKILKDKDLDEFSFLNLYSGKFWEKYEQHFNKKKHVHNYLLRNLEAAREQLFKTGLPYNIIHNIIGRLIFSRYLLDRNLLKNSFFQKKYNSEFVDIISNKRNLYDYFNYLITKFNGDLFPLKDEEKNIIEKKHLDILHHLFMGTNLPNGQQVLFDIFDFSIIPVELISNIYEKFLYKKEKNKNKSYFTPLFLVDYILNNTLDEILEKKNTSNCKILDPACGSGVFLVESLRRLIEKEKKRNGGNLTNSDLEKIVTNNIFGIDKDEDAINLSIFSIYLTLLDYLKINNIENIKFFKLKNKNLFVSDFFDKQSDFNFKIKEIDLIIGNPPWGKVENGLYLKYSKENEIPISDKQIAQSFLFRVRDFAISKTKIALIVTSKVLYNIRGNKFRQQFLKEFEIKNILEFSALRWNVFLSAIGPGAIIFYKCAENKRTYDNVIEHISLKPNRFFKLFQKILIEKYDVKYIPQKYFIKYDWLWKTVLYGNVLDFYFIKRLKENFSTINDIIKEKGLLFGQGLQKSKSDKEYDASHLKGKPYLDAKEKRLKRYFINTINLPKWDKKLVNRSRNPEIFKAPFLLIKKSLNKNCQAIAAFSNKDMVFTDHITAIKGESNNINMLKNSVALFNSKLFTYYIFQTSSSLGIEREQCHNEGEKFTFPWICNDEILQKVDELEILARNDDTKSLNKAEKKLNQIIEQLYELSDNEKDLIDYVIDISIPLYQGENPPFKSVEKEELTNYADIFIDYFEQRFIAQNRFFQVDIYRNRYFVAMNFKTIYEDNKEKIKFIENEDTFEILEKIFHLSKNKVKDIYIQKDIKGFDESAMHPFL